MEFLIRLLKASAIFFIAVLILFKSGLDTEQAKFQVIAILTFWASVFYFLHPYMAFIAIIEVFPYPGFRENRTDGVVWKFLASMLFGAAILCYFLW